MGIREFMSVWKNMNLVEGYARRSTIKEGIEAKLLELDGCRTFCRVRYSQLLFRPARLTSFSYFQASAQLALNDWAQDFEKAYVADADMLSRIVANTEQTRKEFLELMPSDSAGGICAMMKELQLVGHYLAL